MTCDALKAGGRIGCATSAHLKAENGFEYRKFIAWLQRFHLLKRLMELSSPQRPLNVMALDTDMAVRVNPYASLHTTFRRFTMVTTFDYKGGFANVRLPPAARRRPLVPFACTASDLPDRVRRPHVRCAAATPAT